MPYQIISTKSYPVYIGDIAKPLYDFISSSNYSAIYILCDENTNKFCRPVLINKINELCNTNNFEIQSGEANKTITTCQNVWKWLLEKNADRKALLINLGGGIVGDLGGFCAATYKRGIDFIQIPTSLLAQVDASVGGKLGVNFSYIKNMVGVFQNPKAIFIDPVFLKTLPERHIKNGLAEIIKHALIADENYWIELLKIDALNKVNWKNIILRSVQIKENIVSDDPYEKGLRKILNFGHTIGHALESWSLIQNEDNPLLHGEAIAYGMIAEVYLSYKVLCNSKSKLDEIIVYLQKWFEVFPIKKAEFPDLIRLMKNDKKNRSNSGLVDSDVEIKFSLLENIGHAVYDIGVGEEDIVEALEFLISLS